MFEIIFLIMKIESAVWKICLHVRCDAIRIYFVSMQVLSGRLYDSTGFVRNWSMKNVALRDRMSAFFIETLYIYIFFSYKKGILQLSIIFTVRSFPAKSRLNFLCSGNFVCMHTFD